MTLTAEQLRAREGKLTASRVACLMRGDEAKIMALWSEMVGDPDFVPDDLSGVWPVRLGEATEALNLDWYERKTGRALTRRGEVVICPHADWAAATLDGWDAAISAVVECKHVGGREARQTVLNRYQPQFHWQMICSTARQTMASIIEGSSEPVIETVPFDETYAAELWRRAEAFMQCVRDLTPPIVLAPVAAPVKAERDVSMQGNNAWAMGAADWLANRAAAKKFSTAETDIKELIPSDVKRAHGHGIECTRDRANRLSIKQLEA